MQQGSLALGRQLFDLHCAACHGLNLQGTAQGPPLIDVNAGDVDFELSTGRMPAAIPFEQEEHKTPAFPPEQIRAVVDYVMSNSRGEQTLPAARPPPANDERALRAGRAIYEENCQQCHAISAHGDSVGYQNVAPELMESTPLQIAEAVRMGPDVMPRFGPKIIDDSSLNDLIAYVQFLQHGQYNPGGLQLANWGPVSEGFIAWTFGLGLLVLLVRRIGTTD